MRLLRDEDRAQVLGGTGPVPGLGAGRELGRNPGSRSHLSQTLLGLKANLGGFIGGKIAGGEELLFQRGA